MIRYSGGWGGGGHPLDRPPRRRTLEAGDYTLPDFEDTELDILDWQERQVIRLRFDDEGATFEEIGNAGLDGINNAEEVRRIQNRALGKMHRARNPEWSP